jgi:hypothetical protein
MVQPRKITLNLAGAYQKVCTIRKAGRTFQTSIPKLVLDREARRLGIGLEQIPTQLRVRWFFDNFRGLVALIERKQGIEPNKRVSTKDLT